MSVNVLVAFYSRSGSTEALARSIAEGAKSAGATVRLRRARELLKCVPVTSAIYLWAFSAQ
jgi:NAD(P)H dehydrogenase (quinone)